MTAPSTPAGGGAANPEPFGTVFVPFDRDDETFVDAVAKAMHGTRLRYGGSRTVWDDPHPTTRQRIADVARVAITMTRVRYAPTHPQGPAPAAKEGADDAAH